MADPLDRATLAGLLEMVGDDPEFVSELVDTYLADAPGLLEAMRAAVGADDAEALVRPAHTLKGNSLNLGALELAAIARSLEEQGRSGALDGANARVADAEAEYARVVDALASARAVEWRT